MTTKRSETEHLLAEIEHYLVAMGMRASTFGHKTTSDGKLVQRLRRGGTVTLETASMIRQFMRQGNRSRPKKVPTAQAA